MPWICEWIVTVEIAITWPTGGGSIRTGTLVSTASATSTGTPAAVIPELPREQPPAQNAAISASAIVPMLEMPVNFFIRSSFDGVDFPTAARRLKSHREFP
jgi:hypothetical protein